MPLPLRELGADEDYGSKALRLGQAARAGLPVPDAVAFSAVGLSVLFAAAAAERTAVLGELLERLGGTVAVRSSAAGEDGAAASFAGLHASVLNVRTPAALETALATVRASARSEPANVYRDRHGLGAVSPSMGALVQRLVVPEVSGVLFSRHPVSGAEEYVIEATWGLGEALVSGQVTPDRYRLTPAGRLIETALGAKRVEAVPAAGGGTAFLPVVSPRSRQATLDAAALADLVALAKRCDAVYGASEHDLEWCRAGERTWLLQRRPITVVASPRL